MLQIISELFSFDSEPCTACLVRMQDDMLLLHNWDKNRLFSLSCNKKSKSKAIQCKELRICDGKEDKEIRH